MEGYSPRPCASSIILEAGEITWITSASIFATILGEQSPEPYTNGFLYVSLDGRKMHDFNGVFNDSSIIRSIETLFILLLHGRNYYVWSKSQLYQFAVTEHTNEFQIITIQS